LGRVVKVPATEDQPEAVRPYRPLVYAVMGSGKSVLLSELAWLAQARLGPGECIVIGAPRKNLVEQLGETIRARCGRESVGLYYMKVKQPAKQIVVTCFNSMAELAHAIREQGRTVRLFIADEAHRTACPMVEQALALMAPLHITGCTATPYLADEDARIEIFDGLCVRYPLAEALADGVLVPPVPVEPDEAWIKETGTEGVEALDRVCLRLIEKAAAQDLPLWPCMASAYDIADAEHFVAVLREHGYTAEHVHSKATDEHNARAIRRMRAGEVQIIVQVTKLAEGADYPEIRSLLMRRAMGSDVLRFQFLGRGLRSHPGKTFCTMLDVHQQLRQHGTTSRPEALGAAIELAAAEESARVLRGQGPPPEPREIRLSFVSSVESWASTALGLMAAHPAFTVSQFERGSWRDSRPSDRQIAALESLCWTTSYLPEHARKPVRALLDARELLPSGAVSDLLALLFAISKATKPIRDAAAQHVADTGSHAHKPRWTWPDDLPLSPVPPAPTARQQEAIHAAR
jgi:superfamily II DNA or RNA helicase